MRFVSLQRVLRAAGLVALGSLAACAGPGPVLTGNDIGGIITWNPEHEYYRHQMAGQHCAGYGKTHRITSVHRVYGDYISFDCLWDRRLYRDQIIVRSKG